MPSFATKVCSSNSKAAVTAVSLCTVSWQVAAVPLHAPPQPMKRACGAAVATSVAGLPVAKVALQAEAPFPQVRVPVTCPGPETAADKVTWAGGAPSKCANTCTSLRSVTLHAPGPLQPTPHPANFEPAALVAVSETVVPSGNSVLQGDWVQSMPAGSDTTRPCPSTTTSRRRVPAGGWPDPTLPTGGELSPQARQSARTVATVVSGRTGPPTFTAQRGAA